jgi:glycosyltransferase involved in cell wall biosynthesis
MGVAPGELAVIVVARLFELKRLDLAIDAVAGLPQAIRDRTRLILVGDGPLRDDLGARAQARGIAGRVTFLGFRTDARRLFAGADVALLTSEREAMPLALIEAMLEKAPIVSTPWAGADGMLGDGRYGLIADDFTPDAVAAVLASALTDTASAAMRAAAAADHARAEFDVATQAARYAALYRELSARRRSASPVITAARS